MAEKHNQKIEEKEEISKDKIKSRGKSEKESINQKADEKNQENDNEIGSEKIIKKIVLEEPEKIGAIVNGRNLPISKKHAVAICNYIRGKNIDRAILMLEEVEKMKKAIPMRGEIPHRKGKIMSGRYPIKASGEFIRLLKSLKANAIVKGSELEKFVIFCKADVAPKVYRRFGRTKFKRAHVTLRLIEPIKKTRSKR